MLTIEIYFIKIIYFSFIKSLMYLIINIAWMNTTNCIFKKNLFLISESIFLSPYLCFFLLRLRTLRVTMTTNKISSKPATAPRPMNTPGRTEFFSAAQAQSMSKKVV